jgi:transcriptional regulator with XRE-family HTH domain
MDDGGLSRIGGSLRAARVRRGWTREELAYRSGVSYGAIAQIESGRRRDIRLTSVAALADALDVTIDHLVGRTPVRARPLLEHRAFAYANADEFLAATVPFLAEGADRAESLLAVTTADNVGLLREALAGAAGQVTFVEAPEWYTSPAEALTRYRDFVNARLDEGARWVRVVGEPVWSGRTPTQVAAWIRYEAMVNIALASAAATVVCPYDTRSVPARIVAGTDETHPELWDADGARRSESFVDAERFLLDH